VRFDGTPRDLADVAEGRVWIDDAADARALRAWRTAEGSHRHVGDPPAGAALAEPTIEDGYLLLLTDERPGVHP
jgi:ABC-2 type transport system ATP-binding protein